MLLLSPINLFAIVCKTSIPLAIAREHQSSKSNSAVKASTCFQKSPSSSFR